MLASDICRDIVAPPAKIESKAQSSYKLAVCQLAATAISRRGARIADAARFLTDKRAGPRKSVGATAREVYDTHALALRRSANSAEGIEPLSACMTDGCFSMGISMIAVRMLPATLRIYRRSLMRGAFSFDADSAMMLTDFRVLPGTYASTWRQHTPREFRWYSRHTP